MRVGQEESPPEHPGGTEEPVGPAVPEVLSTGSGVNLNKNSHNPEVESYILFGGSLRDTALNIS